MYNYEIKPSLQKILTKLSKRDKGLYEQVLKKIEEIISCKNIEHHKNLKSNLSDLKRVHIGHFVLVFKLDKTINLISFEDFEYPGLMYKTK